MCISSLDILQFIHTSVNGHLNQYTYYEQRWYKHPRTNFCGNVGFHFFLVYTQEVEFLGHMIILFQLFEKLTMLPSTVKRVQIFLHLHQHLLLDALVGMKLKLMVLICIMLMMFNILIKNLIYLSIYFLDDEDGIQDLHMLGYMFQL